MGECHRVPLGLIYVRKIRLRSFDATSRSQVKRGFRRLPIRLGHLNVLNYMRLRGVLQSEDDIEMSPVVLYYSLKRVYTPERVFSKRVQF